MPYVVESGWSEVFSGCKFEYHNMQPSMVHIEDIGQALGKVARYGGHTHTFYSVAEHSCLMVRYAMEHFPSASMEALRSILMHDATEAYIPDLPRPLKHMMPDFIALEATIEIVIARKFNLIQPAAPIIRSLDNRIILDERAQAMNPSDNVWAVDSLKPLGVKLQFWSPAVATKNFLSDYEVLTNAK